MKLMENVYLIGSGKMGFGISDPGDCHVYLVTDGKDGAIIDAGYGPSAPKIIDNIRNDGIDPDSISKLILTHCHGDHSGAGAYLVKELGLEAISPKGSKDWLEQGDEDSINLSRARAAGRYPEDYSFQTFRVTREVDEGDTILVGSLELETYSTPGLNKFRDLGVNGLFPGHHSISLEYGQAHIDAALAKFDTLTVPRNMMT